MQNAGPNVTQSPRKRIEQDSTFFPPMLPFKEAQAAAEKAGKLARPNLIVAGVLVCFIVLGVLGSGIYFLLHIKLPFPEPTGKLSGIQITKTSIDCPPGSATTNSDGPTLDFCSPIYGGNVAGPAGSHIVLIAQHIPNEPLAWALVDSSIANAQASVAHCFSRTQHTQCSLLNTPQANLIPNEPGGYYLYWTWTSTQGFLLKAPNDYYIVARIGSGASAQFYLSSVSFSLLSSEPPCITIAVTKTPPASTTPAAATSSPTPAPSPNPSSPAHCKPTPTTVQAKAGQTITISGSNWLLGWSRDKGNEFAKVEITATCTQGATCKATPLFDLSQSQASDGTFSVSFAIPAANSSGTYTVTASCSAGEYLPGGPPIDNADIFVGNALTFGNPNDMFSLTLVTQ
jgi:hypothetical protein